MALTDNNQITMDNLDELEVHLTIVAKNPQAVKSTSTFLGRRDWPTKVISNVNEAIESIAKDKPDIVLLSYNHPQLNVEKFATLLSQTFNMTCVGFCETEDRSSMSKFHSSKLRYKLSGAPSGPTVQRFVRKILIEKYGLNVAEENTKSLKDTSADKEDDEIIVTNESGKSYGKTSVVKGEQLATGAIHIDADEKRSSFSDVTEEGLVSKTGHMISESGDFTGGGKAIIQTGSPLNDDPSIIPNEKFSGSLMDAENDEASTAALDLIQDGNLSEDDDILDEGAKSKEKRASGKNKKRAAVSGRTIQSKPSIKDETKAIEEAEEREKEKTAGRSINKKKRLSAVTKPKISQGQRSQTKENLDSKEEKLHGTISEILQTVEPAVELGSHPDDPVEWIGILPLVAKDFHGYLAIPVQTQPNQESEKVLQRIRVSVEQDFTKKGLEPKIEDGFFIQIDPTYFSSLAKGHAQFVLQQGINDEIELCVSYFSSTSATHPIQQVNKTMSAIQVDGVSTENPINFKVYLHFNKNKKYYLYLNTGRTLSGKQKLKLQKRGISSFFIKNTEVENFRKYLAASFVKQLIVSLKEELTADEQGTENKKKENSA